MTRGPPKPPGSCCRSVSPLWTAPEEAANGAQALLLLTEWAEIVDADWEAIAGRMRSPKFLFDGRNALDARHMARLGFDYAGVGRGNSAPS